jgi:A/G-specific adenine glycosylase
MNNIVSTDEGNRFQLLENALEQKRHRIQHGILQWIAGSQPRYQWRQPGETPYQVFIGEFLLTHTSPQTAVAVYDDFLRKFPSLHILQQSGEKAVSAFLKNFGVKIHTGCLMSAGSYLFSDNCLDLPHDSESLCKLPELTVANSQAVFCFGYNLPLVVLDNNSSRLLVRVFHNTLPSVPKHSLLQSVGEALLPYYNPQEFNRGMLELAEMVCIDENPECVSCPLAEVCDWVDNADNFL